MSDFWGKPSARDVDDGMIDEGACIPATLRKLSCKGRQFDFYKKAAAAR
jgi:hypothetical protein